MASGAANPQTACEINEIDCSGASWHRRCSDGTTPGLPIEGPPVRAHPNIVWPAAVAAAVLCLRPAQAEAQVHRGHPGHGGVVVVGGYYATPYWYGGYYAPFFDPWYGFAYPYGPYPYPYYYDTGSSLRLEVTPKKAEVYVDGHYAGIVDDFDGVFQR